MLLSIKEMEVRKIAFAETWQPGEIDFSDAGVRQAGPLKAEGVAELLPHSGEEVRVHGKVEDEARNRVRPLPRAMQRFRKSRVVRICFTSRSIRR